MNIDFLVTSLIVVVSPGTGVLYTLAAGLSRGPRASVVAAFGCRYADSGVRVTDDEDSVRCGQDARPCVGRGYAYARSAAVVRARGIHG